VPPQVLDQVAVVWGPQKNEVRELPPYRDDTEASAIGINDKGEIVGTSGKCKFFNQSFGSIEAILWRNGRPINLGNLGFRLFNIAFSINNKSEVTGQASTSQVSGSIHVFHAYLWRRGVMKDLGTLPGYPFSLGNVINDKTQIVGIAQTASASRAFLWQNGTMYDVNTLVPKHADFNVTAAEGLNDRGQIAGWGIPGNASQVHGFLATPCDSENPDHKGCEDARGSSTSTVFPENVQRTLMRWNASHHNSSTKIEQ
jgi:probable HAF family extracellular repeat protein